MVYLLLAILAVASRLLPHAANVAPIGALALFIGATALAFKSKNERIAAYTLPIVALAISDVMIGLYSWQVMASVYVGFAITIGLGLLVRKSYHWSTIAAASLAGSVIFFLLTNAAVWAFTPMYAKDFSGLLASYTAALPFFRNSLVGDIVYTGVLFGAYELARRANPKTVEQFAIVR